MATDTNGLLDFIWWPWGGKGADTVRDTGATDWWCCKGGVCAGCEHCNKLWLSIYSQTPFLSSSMHAAGSPCDRCPTHPLFVPNLTPQDLLRRPVKGQQAVVHLLACGHHHTDAVHRQVATQRELGQQQPTDPPTRLSSDRAGHPVLARPSSDTPAYQAAAAAAVLQPNSQQPTI